VARLGEYLGEYFAQSVATRVQPNHVLYCLHTTLGMYAVALPRFRREALEERKIHLAEHAE
jgi:hypothetical protein